MRFIFPQNYQFHSRLLGLFDYPTFIFNLILFIFLIVLSNLLFTALEIKVLFCTALFLPVFLFSLLSLHQENIFSSFVAIYYFFTHRRIYFYSKIR